MLQWFWLKGCQPNFTAHLSDEPLDYEIMAEKTSIHLINLLFELNEI